MPVADPAKGGADIGRIRIARALALVSSASFCLGANAIAARPDASVEKTLTQLEKDSWRAWQRRDVAFWQRHLSEDHVEMDGPAAPQTKASVVNAIAGRKCTVPDYSLDNFTFRQFDRDTAMLVYHAQQEFLCGDRHITNIGWVTSLYELRHGKWENVLFEHMSVPPPKLVSGVGSHACRWKRGDQCLRKQAASISER